MEDGPGAYRVNALTRLLSAQRAALLEVETALKAAALPPLAWCEALLTLQRVGRAGIRPHAMEANLLMARDDPAQLLASLEAEGYLEWRHRGSGGRILVITPAGRAILKRIWPVYDTALQGAVGAHMTVAQAAALSEVLGPLMVAPVD